MFDWNFEKQAAAIKAINELIRLLAKNGIPFEVGPHNVGTERTDNTLQVFSPSHENSEIDAICNKYSYGGDEGRIEVMFPKYIREEDDWDDDVRGYLTPEEAYEYFKRVYEHKEKEE